MRRSDAGAAPAVEGQVAVIHLGAAFPGGGGVQLVGDLQAVQIGHGTAVRADEVDVGIDVAVVALHPVDGADPAA